MSTLRVWGPALRALRSGLAALRLKAKSILSPQAKRSLNGAHQVRGVLLQFRLTWAERSSGRT